MNVRRSDLRAVRWREKPRTRSQDANSSKIRQNNPPAGKRGPVEALFGSPAGDRSQNASAARAAQGLQKGATQLIRGIIAPASWLVIKNP
jgi:hypothetical protein